MEILGGDWVVVGRDWVVGLVGVVGLCGGVGVLFEAAGFDGGDWVCGGEWQDVRAGVP